MELIRSIYNLRPKHRGCVATIGKFDGVHLGHKQILMQVKAKAKALGLPSLVILFEPHPSEFFAAEKAPARLSSLTTKLEYLAEYGVDRVLCLTFNKKLSSMTADAFVKDVSEHVHLHQQIIVKVLEIDVARKRIQLKMHQKREN